MIKIFKIGGGIIDNSRELATFLQIFSQVEGKKILVHGGGKSANQLLQKMGIAPIMIEGKRITDLSTLEVVTMTYAGEINKNIVADLQALSTNALGLCGADGNAILATKRPVKQIDYGFVGDLNKASINTPFFNAILDLNILPVVCAITHDGKGQLLNTNADTIAATLAIALAQTNTVELYYCFDKKGVLTDKDNEDSYIPKITPQIYQDYKAQGIITDGMIPKLDNAFATLQEGVKKVVLKHALLVNTDIQTTISLQ